MKPPTPVMAPILLRRINDRRAERGLQPVTVRPDDETIMRLARELDVLKPGEVAHLWDSRMWFYDVIAELYADRPDLAEAAQDMVDAATLLGSSGSLEEYQQVIETIMSDDEGGQS